MKKYWTLIILSVFSALLAPEVYSHSFCVTQLIFVIVTFAFYYKDCKEDGLLTFPVIFSIGFVCVNYLYPTLFYPFPYLRYISMFGYGFNEMIINYATSVATCAYTCIIGGYMYQKNKFAREVPKENSSKKVIISGKLVSFLIVLYWIIVVYFLAIDGLEFFSAQFSHGTMSGNKLGGYLFALISPISFSILLTGFYTKKWIFPLISVLVLCVLVLSTSSRTFPLAMMTTIICLLNDKVRRFGVLELVGMCIVAVLSLSLVGYLRNDEGNITSVTADDITALIDNRSGEESFGFVQELVINNHSLYTLIDYTKKNGINWGVTQLGLIAGIIPGAQSILLYAFGLDAYYLNSASFNTLITAGRGSTKGMGTNAVSDVYLSFGLFGVVIIFFLLGKYARKFFVGKNDSYLNDVAYYVLMSDAIYMCRAPLFGFVKTILWTIFIMWICAKITKTKLQ